MKLESLSLDQLAAVTGGLAQPLVRPAAAAKAAAPAKPAAPLAQHKVGNVKLIGNQTLDQMYWDAKPF